MSLLACKLCTQSNLMYLIFVNRDMNRTALFWVITQQVVVIPYRRFGTDRFVY